MLSACNLAAIVCQPLLNLIGCLRSSCVAELLGSCARALSIKELFVQDPIHGFVDLTEYGFVPEIVETDQFQRLRRISQLGFSYLVYPSACHNRFSHCIGAMQVFWRLFDRLKQRMTCSEEEIGELRKIGTAAVLLHDIGHGPFSHASESALDFDHEQVTKELIGKPPISTALTRHNLDPLSISRVLDGTADQRFVPLSQLVSSQLDVDRLDYLLRDAYFTGIGFGNVDLNRIISTMVLYEKDPLRGQAVNLYKARFSLESYVLTRHLMYQAVYFHKASRGAELLFRNVIKRVRTLKPKDEVPSELRFMAEEREPTASEIEALDDSLLYAQLWRWSKSDDSILSQLCKRILQRKLLKAIEIPPAKMGFMLDEGQKLVQSIAQDKGFDKDYFCTFDSPTDLPYQPYRPKEPDDERNVITNIFVLDSNGRPEEISRVSDVVESLSHTQYSYRLYCPKEIREDVNKALK